MHHATQRWDPRTTCQVEFGWWEPSAAVDDLLRAIENTAGDGRKLRSKVGQFYKNTIPFKVAVEEADRQGLVSIGGYGGREWIESLQCGDDAPELSAAVENLLLGIDAHDDQGGQILRSRVGQWYSSCRNTIPFKEAVREAERRGLVSIGGHGGHAWIESRTRAAVSFTRHWEKSETMEMEAAGFLFHRRQNTATSLFIAKREELVAGHLRQSPQQQLRQCPSRGARRWHTP